jgi:peptidoglycan DL-endopeptidase CwlO
VLSALALASVLYTVKPGDTLSGIAQHYNTTWEAIYDANHAEISNPNMIYAGQHLRIHEGDKSAALTVPAQAAATPAASTASQTPSAPVRSYSVTPAPAASTTQASTSQASTAQSSTDSVSSSSTTSGSGYSSGGLSDIPGVPSSFASCVAYRESTNDTNPAANGNAYGIIPASGYNVSGDSIAQQKQVFKEIYDTTGPSAWAADGCAG